MSRELEHAQGVRRRLLERLVAGDGGHAEELDLRRGDGEHQRDRVVVAGVAVDHDRHGHQVGFNQSSSALAVGSELCAPNVAAAYAPATHARRSATS